jgi:hypothetical protein
MLMVCPNCHSKQILTVQDQQFCINCGQMVPDPVTKANAGGLKIQQNGLPVGVKILGKNAPVADSDSQPKPEPAPEPKPEPAPASKAKLVPSLIQSRHRIAATSPGEDETENQEDSPAVPRPRTAKRKPGRPKAGRLDVPKPVQAEAAVAAVASAAPAPAMDPVSRTPRPRRTHAVATVTPEAAPPKEPTAASADKPSPRMMDIAAPKPKTKTPAHHQVHKVGVPPLHFGHVIATSLRSRFGRHHLALASLAAVVFASTAAAGAWLFLDGQLPSVANRLMGADPRLLAELVLLAVLYYIGRSVGQAAIIYGVAREADHRPVGLSSQLGIAINGFGRRLGLDLVFGAAQLSVLSAIVLLAVTGGTPWRYQDFTLNPQIQLGVIFTLFLLLLYLMTALALSHGLANVAVVLTKNQSTEAAKLGWRLFSHRFELLGWRFLSLALEMLIAVPVAAAALALLVIAPTGMIWLLSLGVGVLAWVLGAVIGSGTATWWAALYRKLVLVDHPAAEAALLSSRTPVEAHRGALTTLVAVSCFLIAACLALPWLQMG